MAIDPTTAKRVRYDGLEGYLSQQLDPGATTMYFKEFLAADGGAPIADLLANEYIVISILDPNYRLSEIVYLVSYTSGNLSGIIERGREGTQSNKTHAKDNKFVHSATVLDYVMVQDHEDNANAHGPILDQANAYTDGKMADHLAAVDPHPIYAKKAGDTFTGPVIFDGTSNTTTVKGTLDIPVGAVLTVEGELRITGKFILNGKEIIVSNTPPSSPAGNTIYIQTFG